ncbi:radical SAM/SPASM domain-containing protein [Thermodesulfobacteriota bacterium]
MPIHINNKTRQLLAPLYFRTLPHCNYFINLLRHNRFTRQYIPREFHIEVTSHCNANCIMCPQKKMNRKRGYMSWQVFTKIIDECAVFEGTGLWMNLHKDGEPLLDPMLFARINYIRKKLKKSHIHFSSNASLLTNSIIDKLLESPPDSIVFSVDGTTSETYEQIRRGLLYQKTKENLENFFKRKKKALHSKTISIMQMVVNDQNKNQKSDYFKMWHGKADKIMFKDMHNFLDQKTSVHGCSLSYKMLSRCWQPFSTMIVFWNGDVGLCCWDYENFLKLGNIERSSLLEIFNNDMFLKVRTAMIRKDCKNIPVCSKCSRIYGKDNP